MAIDNDIAPGGLHPDLVKRLLDRLETDNEFRIAFADSAEKALRSIGYIDPWACLQLKPGAELASPEQIKMARSALESRLVSVQHQLCPLDSQEAFSIK